MLEPPFFIRGLELVIETMALLVLAQLVKALIVPWLRSAPYFVFELKESLTDVESGRP